MITIDLKYEIEKTKDSYDIVKISKDNKWIYIGSKYNTKLEIDKFLGALEEDDSQDRIFFVYGFGAGEHINALRNKYANNKILVFEPNINLKEYIDKLTWVKQDENLVIICCEKDKLIENLSKYVEEYNLSFIKFTNFSNYNKIYAIELKNFLEEVKNYVVSLSININTSIEFSKRWFETLINNIPYIVNGSPIDLYKNKYKNKPAVIVSAGPSLEKNIDQLKQLNNEMLIMSGGRTLKAVIDKNIRPNLVTVADPEDLAYELVKGYIENLNIPLLFYEGTNEKVVRNHGGEKIFFSVNSFIDRISEKKLMAFAAGGSVAHTMTKCAIFFGCNPIIFIGQDLAYTNDEKYSSISGNRDLIKNDDYLENTNNLWVEDINGGKVRTSAVLNQFRRSFEGIIKHYPQIEFINATEGGARMHGTIEMPLEEVINKYRGENIEEIGKIENSIDMKKNAVDALSKAKESANFIINRSKKALKYLGELKTYYTLKKNNKINSILKKLDAIDEEIKEQFIDVDLVASLLYPIVYKTLISKSVNSENPNLNEMKDIVEQNKKLYEEILNELKYSIKYIEETLLKI